jgi:hypothetical protein
VTAKVPSSLILFSLMMEEIRSSETSDLIRSMLHLLFTANVPSPLILFTLT